MRPRGSQAACQGLSAATSPPLPPTGAQPRQAAHAHAHQDCAVDHRPGHDDHLDPPAPGHDHRGGRHDDDRRHDDHAASAASRSTKPPPDPQLYSLYLSHNPLAAGTVECNVHDFGQDPHTFAIEAQAAVQVSANLPPGQYTLLCTMSDHAALGMSATLVVEQRLGRALASSHTSMETV